jgi:hypothetical protein
VKRTQATAWLVYAGVALAAVAVSATLAAFLAGISTARATAIWVAALLAYALQLAAFALLIAFRDQAQLFLMAWAGGMVLRVLALVGCAYWVSQTNALPRAPLLLGYVGFVFLLVLLEPLFLRWDLRG